jgi:type IV pilus assembly protein PilC
MSAAFEEHGADYLPITFFETVRAGEAMGNLAGSFRSLQEHYEKDSLMKSKVKSALSYPIFVLVVAVVVVAILMVRVVPVFTEMFTDLGSEMPVMMAILIAVSNFFRKYIFVMIAIVLIVVVIIRLYGLSESGRNNLAKARLKMPIFGKIEELNAASQFANTMAAMLGAGLPIVRAVEITSRVVTNYYMSGQTSRLVAQLESGRSLNAAMRDITDYPDILVDMVGVGESSGEPERTLSLTAKYYDQELEDATKAAVAKLEPTLLLVLAGIVGFIVIAVFTGMFSLYGAMGV